MIFTVLMEASFSINKLFILSIKKFKYLKISKMVIFADNPRNNNIFRDHIDIEFCILFPITKVANVEIINNNKNL